VVLGERGWGSQTLVWLLGSGGSVALGVLVAGAGHLRWSHIVGKGLHMHGQGDEVRALMLALAGDLPRRESGFD